MSSRPPHIPVVALVCVVASLGPSARGQGDWELLDRELRRQRVELTQMRDGMVSFVDADGRTRSRPVSSLLALIHEEAPPDRPARELPWIREQAELFGPLQGGGRIETAPFHAWIELTDGQRWSGRLASADGDALTWSLRGVLDLPLPLDRVRTIALRAAPGAGGVEDRVGLINGDVLEGFVASLGETARIEIGSGDVEIPLGRVASVVLTNPATAPTGALVWTDEDLLSVRAVEILVTGRVLLQMGSETPDAALEVSTSGIRAVLLDAPAISSLAAMAPERVEHPAALAWAGEPVLDAAGPLDAHSIELRGPVVVRWRLEREALRFAAVAVLPPAMWAWGDCEVVVRSDGAELLREHLSAERPEVEINVPLGGSTALVVEIDSGASGPVQDHVRLEAPIVSWR